MTLAQDMTIALIRLEMKSGYDIESVATVCSINEGGICTVRGTGSCQARLERMKALETAKKRGKVGEVEPSGFRALSKCSE